MGSDRKKLVRQILTKGFENYDKNDFKIINGSKHTKIYYKNQLVKSISQSPKDPNNRAMLNLKAQMRKAIQEVDSRLKKADK